MNTNCPHCRNPISIPPGLTGAVECPTCNGRFTVRRRPIPGREGRLGSFASIVWLMSATASVAAVGVVVASVGLTASAVIVGVLAVRVVADCVGYCAG